MDKQTLATQRAFQAAVSHGYERLEHCFTMSAHTKSLLLDYLQTAAASSDEAIALKERIDIAQEALRERTDLSARDQLTVRRYGNTILNAAIRI